MENNQSKMIIKNNYLQAVCKDIKKHIPSIESIENCSLIHFFDEKKGDVEYFHMSFKAGSKHFISFPIWEIFDQQSPDIYISHLEETIKEKILKVI